MSLHRGVRRMCDCPCCPSGPLGVLQLHLCLLELFMPLRTWNSHTCYKAFHVHTCVLGSPGVDVQPHTCPGALSPEVATVLDWLLVFHSARSPPVTLSTLTQSSVCTVYFLVSQQQCHVSCFCVLIYRFILVFSLIGLSKLRVLLSVADVGCQLMGVVLCGHTPAMGRFPSCRGASAPSDAPGHPPPCVTAPLGWAGSGTVAGSRGRRKPLPRRLLVPI